MMPMVPVLVTTTGARALHDGDIVIVDFFSMASAQGLATELRSSSVAMTRGAVAGLMDQLQRALAVRRIYERQRLEDLETAVNLEKEEMAP